MNRVISLEQAVHRTVQLEEAKLSNQTENPEKTPLCQKKKQITVIGRIHSQK